MRERHRSPGPTPAFRRLLQMMKLLQNRGLPEVKIDEFLREKIRIDLAHEEHKRRFPEFSSS